jgi:hypothetical protein
LIYDSVTNRTGARCDIYDNQVNVYGKDPATGFARRPLDNVGVQYGLEAFNTGRITAEQFLDLNMHVGGYDPDGNIVPRRSTADPDALRKAYENGRMNMGGGSLGAIPIIDFRRYYDPDLHDRYRSFAVRARLIAANGSADNQVILTVSPKTAQKIYAKINVLNLMNQWLDNIARDTSHDSASRKVARNKPAELTDACWTPEGDKITEPQTYDGPGRCNQLYPNHANPRIAAGAPLADDILKCALKPLDPKDYVRPITADQMVRIKAIFPEGVCDYSLPGVGQQKLQETWQTY